MGKSRIITHTDMNYELAKKLKDVGFPKLKDVKDEYLDQIPNHPTLSELILACGEKFGYLCRWEKGNDKGDWQAISYAGDVIEWAMTHEEATANLWLALHTQQPLDYDLEL